MTLRQQAVFDATDSGRMSERVLEAVAETDSAAVLDSDQRLYDAIDPDALDRLFQHGGIDGTLEFAFAGHRVTIEGAGEITILGRQD